MAKFMQIDEIHLAIYVRHELADRESRAVRQTLLGVHFHNRLAQAVRAVVRRFPALGDVRVTITR